ncbi:MAG: multidrug ABC transporter ATP-binding protein, partial [Acidobacteriota bacterium]
DEPTVGLDPKQIIAIRELIRDLGRERTLLLSTHILPEVEALCDRVLIIDGGRLIAEGTPRELQNAARGGVELTLTLADADGVPLGEVAQPETSAALAALDGVESVASLEEPGRFRLDCAADADRRADVFRLAVARGWVLLELAERRVSLEDVFVRLTARAAGGEEAAS